MIMNVNTSVNQSMKCKWFYKHPLDLKAPTVIVVILVVAKEWKKERKKEWENAEFLYILATFKNKVNMKTVENVILDIWDF